MRANSPVESFWQLGLSHQTSTSLFPSIHYVPPLIIFASIIIRMLQLILSHQFFLVFTSPTHLPKSHCSSAAEVKQQLIPCWYDWIRHRMMEGGKKTAWRDASFLIFIWVEYLNLTVIAERMLRRTEHGKRQGNKQVAESLYCLHINLLVSCPN